VENMFSFFTFYGDFGIFLQVTIVDISSPIGASLYNIGTILCSTSLASC